jgi:hypothetical protein
MNRKPQKGEKYGLIEKDGQRATVAARRPFHARQ